MPCRRPKGKPRPPSQSTVLYLLLHEHLLCAGDRGELARASSQSDMWVLGLSTGIREGTQSKDKTHEKGELHTAVKSLLSAAPKNLLNIAPENLLGSSSRQGDRNPTCLPLLLGLW